MSLLTKELKKSLDDLTYSEMLKMWRFGHAPAEMFQDEVGDYFMKEMFRKRDLLPESEQVAISKNIGWKKSQTT